MEKEFNLTWEDFPALVELKSKIKLMKFGTLEYWKMRCKFLEQSIDNTYTIFARENAKMFYLMLCKKQ